MTNKVMDTCLLLAIIMNVIWLFTLMFERPARITERTYKQPRNDKWENARILEELHEENQITAQLITGKTYAEALTLASQRKKYLRVNSVNRFSWSVTQERDPDRIEIALTTKQEDPAEWTKYDQYPGLFMVEYAWPNI